MSKGHSILIGAMVIAAMPVFAAEDAVLTNGFRIRAERHEAQGDHVVLYTQSGVTEITAASIERFEEVEAPPPANPPVEAAGLGQAARANSAAIAAPATPRELLRDAA